jgi:hypothetical protein
MTEEQFRVIQALRDEGHAVTVFEPGELNGADKEEVEEAMAQRGWEMIGSDEDDDDEEDADDQEA